MEALEKLGSAPAPGAAADALVRRRERVSASRHPCFLLENKLPPGLSAVALALAQGGFKNRGGDGSSPSFV